MADGDSVLVNDYPTWAERLGIRCLAAAKSTVADGLARFEECDVYLAQFGVWSAWKRIEQPRDFMGNLEALCRKAPKVVLVTPPMQVIWGPYNQEIVRYTEMVREVARRMKVVLVDAASRMRAETIGDEDNYIANDKYRNHFRLSGHELVARYVSEVIA